MVEFAPPPTATFYGDKSAPSIVVNAITGWPIHPSISMAPMKKIVLQSIPRDGSAHRAIANSSDGSDLKSELVASEMSASIFFTFIELSLSDSVGTFSRRQNSQSIRCDDEHRADV